ncbi:helix-turn-helix domain-containing protein [Pandoraea pneumonica]|uniref:helix-turn-helix domain-containing protein n=1 Tax=Pandoraea pneumonica TaxID=2508299 RepID=UPI003CEB1D01
MQTIAFSPEQTLASEGRFLFVAEGGVWLRTGRRAYCVMKGWGAWVPPGVLTTVCALGDPTIVELQIAGEACLDLPDSVTLLHGSELLRSVFSAYAAGETSDHAKEALGILLAPELRAAPLSPSALTVDMPSQNSRLGPLCDAVLREPTRTHTPMEAATAAGMSTRTMSRLFNQELGTSMANWRRDVQIATALCALENGQSVTDIADALGFRGSAFSTFFKAKLGCTARAKRNQAPAQSTGRDRRSSPAAVGGV